MLTDVRQVVEEQVFFFSRCFDRKGRLEVGLYFFSSFGSNDSFLNKGFTTAVLK